MISVFANRIKPIDELVKNSFFTLNDSHFTIKYKDENVIFKVDSVSNVRYFQRRNCTINRVLLFSILLAYSIITDYLFKNIYNIFFMFVFFTIVSVFFLLIKNYSDVLLINMGPFHFKEFKLSKKQSAHAKQFVSAFKSKYHNNKYQNDVDLLNLH